MVFVKNRPFFTFFRQYRPNKCVLRYSRKLERKNVFPGYKKLQESKNWDFSKRVSPWFWSKIGLFSHVFLGNIGQTNVFYDILERKNVLPGYKKLQESKNWDFSKGVSPWFRSKTGHVFHLFIFGNTGQKNLFDDILERKNAVLGYKNKKSKKSKNWHFSKRVNPWFWSKSGHFSNFFFRQYRLQKCLLRYSRKKNCLSRL